MDKEIRVRENSVIRQIIGKDFSTGGVMEDTQDKVRRNLVVFSAAIVIGWFLDLKLTAITQLFVSTSDLINADARKLWIVTFAVLVYLFLRYKFDTATNFQLTADSTTKCNTRKTSLHHDLERCFPA